MLERSFSVLIFFILFRNFQKSSMYHIHKIILFCYHRLGYFILRIEIDKIHISLSLSKSGVLSYLFLVAAATRIVFFTSSLSTYIIFQIFKNGNRKLTEHKQKHQQNMSINELKVVRKSKENHKNVEKTTEMRRKPQKWGENHRNGEKITEMRRKSIENHRIRRKFTENHRKF